jgi:RNA polymerase sigma-70 factor (ECF subfamily)
MVPVEAEDRALVVRSQRGDAIAFASLVDRHKSRVLTVCAHLLGNLEDAKDVTQETFLRAFVGLSGFRNDARFSTWLCRIAANLSLNALRRRRPRPEALDDTTSDGEPAPDVALARRERGLRVREALQRLSPELRLSVVLCDTVGLSYAEIAECTRVPLGTVKSRISAARETLRRLLGDLDDV